MGPVVKKIRRRRKAQRTRSRRRGRRPLSSKAKRAEASVASGGQIVVGPPRWGNLQARGGSGPARLPSGCSRARALARNRGARRGRAPSRPCLSTRSLLVPARRRRPHRPPRREPRIPSTFSGPRNPTTRMVPPTVCTMRRFDLACGAALPHWVRCSSRSPRRGAAGGRPRRPPRRRRRHRRPPPPWTPPRPAA